MDPIQTTYHIPQNAYFQSSLGQIFFLIQDRDRDINLHGYDDNPQSELGFSKPICDILTEVPYRLLCKSNVYIANSRSEYNINASDGYLIVTELMLISNNNNITFPKALRIKFENIVRRYFIWVIKVT